MLFSDGKILKINVYTDKQTVPILVLVNVRPLVTKIDYTRAPEQLCLFSHGKLAESEHYDRCNPNATPSQENN